MSYVLIAVFMLNATFDSTKAVTYQEFSSQKSCEAAIKSTYEVARNMGGRTALQMMCVPK